MIRFLRVIFRIMKCVISAFVPTAGIGIVLFFIAGIAQWIFNLSDGVAMAIVFVPSILMFLFMFIGEYQADKEEKYLEDGMEFMKKEYKKRFGKDYVRGEYLRDEKESDSAEYVVEDRWTGMPQYRIKKDRNGNLVVEDYWTGMPQSRIKKK